MDDAGTLSTTTLYCSGFPIDVRYREVRNLFQYFKGFLRARLVEKRKVPIAFATFDSYENALVAKERIHGSFFEEDATIDLRLQFAKLEKPILKRKREPSIFENDLPSKKGPNAGQMTMKIEGLAPDTTKEEIMDLVNQLSGYKAFRWSPSKRKHNGTPIAFVDFLSEREGLAALDAIDGKKTETVLRGIVASIAEKQVPNSGRNRDFGRERDYGRDRDYGHGYFGEMPPFPPPPGNFNMGRHYPSDYPYGGHSDFMDSRRNSRGGHQDYGRNSRGGHPDYGYNHNRSFRERMDPYRI